MPNQTFILNGRSVTVDAPDDMPLLWVLRDTLGLTGAKYGCGVASCGACTCLLDGEVPIMSCSYPVSEAAGREITTIEGLAQGEVLHPVQEAWLEQDVAQCGFCQPGQIMAAVALLKSTKNPTDEDIDSIDNICRCATYFRIRQAIHSAAGKLG